MIKNSINRTNIKYHVHSTSRIYLIYTVKRYRETKGRSFKHIILFPTLKLARTMGDRSHGIHLRNWNCFIPRPRAGIMTKVEML